MNALEFLNTELKAANLNFKAYEIGMQGKGATADIGFEGDGFLNAVSISINDFSALEISWFSSSCSDTSKALEFACMMHVVGAIASKWDAAIIAEDLHILGLEDAEQFKEKNMRINGIKAYRKITGLGLKESKDAIIKAWGTYSFLTTS